MNYLGESLMDIITPDVPPVVIVAPVYGQLNYSPSNNTPLLTSGQLSTSSHSRLLTIVLTVNPPYYVESTSGINTPDNIAFELVISGSYKLRYRVGIQSDVATSQSISLILRVNNIFLNSSEQIVSGVSNAGITYHDFEFLFTTTTANESVCIFAQAETTATALRVYYLNFNIFSL